MYLVHMRPEQVQDAVRRNVAVVIPAGCVEYHGPHLPIGTDFLIANSVCVAAEKRVQCVLAPPLSFAPTMAWAAGPEEGEADFDPEALFVYAREALRRIAAMGFRRIYILQQHLAATLRTTGLFAPRRKGQMAHPRFCRPRRPLVSRWRTERHVSLLRRNAHVQGSISPCCPLR